MGSFAKNLWKYLLLGAVVGAALTVFDFFGLGGIINNIILGAAVGAIAGLGLSQNEKQQNKDE